MQPQAETFVLFDIEADGPVPGRHSMLSFAAVAFNLDKTVIGTFERNVTPLPGATQDAAVMKWWEKYPEAWAACHENAVAPELALPELVAWIRQLPNLPVIFIAGPISFDWMFMAWYLHAYTDVIHSPAHESPFYLFALDMPSFAYALIDKPFRELKPSSYPKEWKKHGIRHTHKAIDDAMGHAMTFCAMMQTARSQKQ